MSAVLASSELKPIVKKLVQTFPTSLGHIDPDRIVYVRSPGKRRAATLKAVPTPYDLFVQERFILTAYSNRYDKLDDDRRAVAIFDELLRINDFDAGKLSSHSIVGNFETLARWGTEWETSGDKLDVFGSKS